MQGAQRAWGAEAGWVERWLISIGSVRNRAVAHVAFFLRQLTARLARRRDVRMLLWALTLRLPGEFGCWLRARRLRGVAVGRRRARLFLARSARPTVSVVIPSFGQVPLTLRCLGAIAADPPAASLEVIVVDDCSGDPKLARLRRVRGLRLVSTPRNLGFIGAANYGAGLARGELLLFLNNDAFVRPGAIDALVATLLARADAGAAGAKLLFPDGTLQEAGGIVWRDGTGWNYGRGDDPALPVYNYVRAVDYCSAASLMMRRELFEALGGFDNAFAPAYFEDTDLAFRLRARGFQTLYQPLAEVVHIEGASHGTDTRRGVKAHQEINRARFVARWQEVLDRDHLPPGADAARARDRAARRRIALVIDHSPPEPDRDAGSQSVIAIVTTLRDAGFTLKFWAEVIHAEHYVQALQQEGIEVRSGDAGAFETWLAKNGDALDLVLINRPHVAATYLGPLHRHSGARVAYNGMDLHGRRLAMEAGLKADTALVAAAARVERLERWVWRSVDLALYLSDEEVRLARKLEPSARIAAIAPFCFPSFPPPRSPPEGAEMLFVGGFAHSPNQDAICWFVDQVLPRVRERMPAARLVIAGSAMPPAVLALAAEDVAVLPEVPAGELRRLYARVRVAVAPLRFGAGVKLKVVEALREGTPLVTTPVGAQGLPGLDQVAFVVDEAEAFAASVRALLTDDALWVARSRAQMAYARRRFSRKSFDRSLLGALGLAPPRHRAVPRPAPRPGEAGLMARLPRRARAENQMETLPAAE